MRKSPSARNKDKSQTQGQTDAWHVAEREINDRKQRLGVEADKMTNLLLL